jgi:hypothetical protein
MLTNNEAGSISDAFTHGLVPHGTQHFRGAPAPPTSEKIERWHESLNNLTPVDVYFRRGRPS